MKYVINALGRAPCFMDGGSVISSEALAAGASGACAAGYGPSACSLEEFQDFRVCSTLESFKTLSLHSTNHQWLVRAADFRVFPPASLQLSLLPVLLKPQVLALLPGRTGDVLAQSASNQLEQDVAKAMLKAAEEKSISGAWVPANVLGGLW